MSRRKIEAPSREDTTEETDCIEGHSPQKSTPGRTISQTVAQPAKKPRTLAQTFATLSYLKEPIRIPWKPMQGAMSSWET
jgi:hypothetical protein